MGTKGFTPFVHSAGLEFETHTRFFCHTRLHFKAPWGENVMKRRTLLKCLAAQGALSVLPVFWPMPAQAEGQEMALALRYALAHSTVTDVFQPWVENMYAKTQGELNIKLYPTGAICPDSDIYSSVLTEKATLGAVSPSSLVPPPPLSLLLDYPLLYPSTELGSGIVWEMLQQYPPLQEEWSQVELLWAWISAPVVLHSMRKPIKRLKDLAGVKVIIWGQLEEALVLKLGGIPVHTPPKDSSNLLRLGLAETIMCPLAPLESLDMVQYLNYTVELPLTTISFIMAINKEVWYALPEEYQQLLKQSTGLAMSMASGRALDNMGTQLRQSLLAKGHTFIDLAPEERDAWTAGLRPLLTEAEHFLDARGVAGARGFGAKLDSIKQELLKGTI